MTTKTKYTAIEGCDSSRADAKHDFHDIFNKDIIQEFVKKNIPTNATCQPPAMDEDSFLGKYLLKSKSDLSTMQGLINKDIPGKFAEASEQIFQVSDRYKIYKIYRPQHTSDPKCYLQLALKAAGIEDDVFFICDVAYANVREDLTNVESGTGKQTMYWVQNTQTLYDPAGKTAWHTGADYGFKDDSKNFSFCWENANLKTMTYYPIWPTTKNEYEFKEGAPETMLYTNKNMYMGIRSDKNDIDDYKKHDSVLVITDPKKPGYYAFADKDLSAKGNGILSKSQITSYRSKGDDLRNFVKFLKTEKGETVGDRKILLDEVMDYSSEIQILAKKVGDASQSLSCCNKVMHFQEYKNKNNGPKGGKPNVKNFDSNGNHAFVSFDRIAVGCALNYNAPIVLQNTQEGFLLYVREDLINADKQFSKYESLGTEIKDSVEIDLSESEKTECLRNMKEYLDDLKTNLSRIDSDEKYKSYLCQLFLILPALQLGNTLGSFLEESNNDNIKQSLSSTLQTINELLASDEKINVPTSESLITFINSLLPSLKENFNILIRKVIKKSGKIDENANKPLFIKLKNVYSIYASILQIQTNFENSKKTLSEITSLLSTVSKCTVGSLTDRTKKLPKGVKDNISNCMPFHYSTTQLRDPKNADGFIDRATQCFGTTTLILPIFEVLNKNKAYNDANTQFVSIILDLLNDKLPNNAKENNNMSFLNISQIANDQLIQNGFLLNPERIEETLIKNKNEESAKVEEIIEEIKAHNDEIKVEIAAEDEELGKLIQQDKDVKVKKNEKKIDKIIKKKEARNKAPEIIPIDEIKAIDTSTIRDQPEASDEETQAYLKKMKLLIPVVNIKKSDGYIESFFQKTTESAIKREIAEFKAMIDQSEEDSDERGTRSTRLAKLTAEKNRIVFAEKAKKAAEIELFLKGLFGIFTFMKFIKQSGKSLPIIFGTSRNQTALLNTFISITETLLFPETTIIPESLYFDTATTAKREFDKIKGDLESSGIDINKIKLHSDYIEIITAGLSGQKLDVFKDIIDSYNVGTSIADDVYLVRVKSKIYNELNANKDIINQIGEEFLSNKTKRGNIIYNNGSTLENKLGNFRIGRSRGITIGPNEDYIKFIGPYVEAFHKFYEDYNRNGFFSVNSFRTIIESNTLAFDNKPLTGLFEGLNANQFNYNMALLYYVENELSKTEMVDKLTKCPPIYDDESTMTQLLKQLFPTFTMRGGLIRGGGDITTGIQSIFQNLGLSVDEPIFNKAEVLKTKRKFHFYLSDLNETAANSMWNEKADIDKYVNAIFNPITVVETIAQIPKLRSGPGIPGKIESIKRGTTIKTGGNKSLRRNQRCGKRTKRHPFFHIKTRKLRR